MKYRNDEISNVGEFRTDANGRQFMRRIRNQRCSYNLEDGAKDEPISSNYYPVSAGMITFKKSTKYVEKYYLFSAIGISNASIGMGFNVLTDRSQGGSSINDGWVELMVHRRCLNDDDAGVAEPLNEKAYGEGLVARGQGVLTHFVQNESLLILNVLAG